MNAIIDSLQFQLGKIRLPGGSCDAFLDEVRAYSEKVERELGALTDSREQLLAIINLIPVAFFVKDHESRFFLMNHACEEQWGLSFAQLRNTDASQFFPPDQMELFLAKDRSIFESRQPVEFEETFWSAAKQENRIGYTFKRPVYDANGNPKYLVCVTLDITDRKRAEAALLDSETRLREAITHSPSPMIMHAEGGEIIMMSNVVTEITGYTQEDLPTMDAWSEKAYGAGAEKAQGRIKALYGLEAVRYEGESTVMTVSGDIRVWDIQSQPLPKLPDGRRVILSSGVDITERKRMQKELQALATTDSLTGLPNRREFNARLADELAKVQRLSTQHGSILMLDLDSFKVINDTHGHSAGDAVLQHFAQLMRNTLRTVDIAARLGGEEFAIILPGANPVAACTFAERLREIVAKTPLAREGKTISMTVSIGIAAIDPRDSSSDTLIRADEALYRAKGNGRNRTEVAESHDDRVSRMQAPGSDVEPLTKTADSAMYLAKEDSKNGFRFFEPEMDARLAEGNDPEQELRHALAAHEFEVHYQRVVSIETRRNVGVEALVRWRHPLRGLISPDKFISLAEETGLINALGEWVLRQACTDAIKWPSYIKVAVNLSAVQFQKPDLASTVARILAESGLPPERLELEITESVLLRRSDKNIRTLGELRGLGVSIALDDFGTGHSSLTYLRMFSFNNIKIDRSFVSDMPQMDTCAAIVCAIANLGRNLDIVTTAEGVETEEQLELLRAAGCTHAQGYLFGRPCPVANLDFDNEIAWMPPKKRAALTARDIMLVRTSFSRLVPIQDSVAGLFYDRLFSVAPELRRLFPIDLGGQKRKLMALLATCVGKLDNFSTVAPFVKDLGARHIAYGAKTEHYAIVSEALLGTLEETLGDIFTPEIRSAWTKVYDVLTATMQAGAAEAAARRAAS